MSVQERLASLKDAYNRFEEFRVSMTTERDKAGAIKAFEFTYELCWKLMKDILAKDGFELASPKAIFRKAADVGIIKDPEVWFLFQEKRNLSSHVYDEQEADEVIASFEAFSFEAAALITETENLYGK